MYRNHIWFLKQDIGHACRICCPGHVIYRRNCRQYIFLYKFYFPREIFPGEIVPRQSIITLVETDIHAKSWSAGRLHDHKIPTMVIRVWPGCYSPGAINGKIEAKEFN